MRMLSCSPGLWRASAYQSGLTGASMSLTDLWAAHTSGDRGLKKMSTASMPSAAVVQGSAAAPLKRKRVSDDTIQQQKPQSRARASARSLPAGETDLGSGSILIYKPRTFKQSQQLFKTLQAEVNWISRKISIFGKEVLEPRQIAYMADSPSLSYTYSKMKMMAAQWHPEVEYLKASLEELAGVKFNSCLLNLYRDGKDHVSWHSDNEKLYGEDPAIGSLSFGATRRFLLRNNEDHSQKWECSLASGDVLIMKGTTQRFWTHSIPKAMQVLQPRINLTFRQITRPE